MADWNGFRGKAKRIEDIDLPRIGHIIGVGEDAIHAIIDVESRGFGFDAEGRPIMLFEPHIFHRQLRSQPKKLQRAIDAGLAYASWGEKPYPKDSYPRLLEAMKIDETAALRSASWGLGQIMGFNHGAAGFRTVQAMVRAFMDDEDAQLEAMVRFILANQLDDELRALEAARTREQRIEAARGFARGYNGSGYEKNRYHIRIADRYEWWQGKPDTPWSPHDASIEEAKAGLDRVAEDLEGDIIEMQIEDALAEELARPEPRGLLSALLDFIRSILNRLKGKAA